MRFLVRLANQRQYRPTDTRRLTTRAYETVRPFDGDVGNVRVSTNAVELDLLLDSNSNLEKALQALEREIGPLLTTRQLDLESPVIGDAEAVKLGLSLFNEERYWESHEALETAWRRLTGPEKEILQGLILLAAALVHLQKDETNIALSIMSRANQKLDRYEGEHFGVNISLLKGTMTEMISAGHPRFLKIETR